MKIKKSQIEILPEDILPPGQRSNIHPNINYEVEIEPRFEETPKSYPWGNNLRPETAAEFSIKTLQPGKYTFPGFGTIDLRDLTPDQARELVSKGFQFLVKR